MMSSELLVIVAFGDGSRIVLTNGIDFDNNRNIWSANMDRMVRLSLEAVDYAVHSSDGCGAGEA